MKTCRQFVNLFLSLFILLLKKKIDEKKKKIFVSKWRKMALKLQEFIFLVCNSFPSNMSVFRDYLISYNFRVAERGLTFLEYKQKEKVECFPLVLPSKRLVVVLQDTAKKYIKALATSETRLSHLVCKISAANPGIKLSGLEMKTLIHTCFY